MKLLRNQEVRRILILQVVLSTIFTGCAWIFAPQPQWCTFVLIICIAFILVYLISTAHRYQRIAELASDVDRILHEDSPVLLDQYSEGELAILQIEIHKMTIRLREQQQHLLDDKIYLADSIADISHQIRTPLTSINLLVSFLSEPDLTPERRLKLSQELFDLLARIDWLITTLLKISKLDAGTAQFKKETLPLADLIRKAAAPVAIPMELQGQELQIEAAGSWAGDTAWTCEALGNILKNCMEHTPNGGRILVTTEENTLYTEIIIRDTGCGIAPEDLPHIFERFYKGKNSSNASFGIGLALARMIIIAQNGAIKAENCPDGGAKFTIRFYKGVI